MSCKGNGSMSLHSHPASKAYLCRVQQFGVNYYLVPFPHPPSLLHNLSLTLSLFLTLSHSLGIPDHRVLSNRSRAYLAMERLSEALADTELCCKLKPTWPKVHYNAHSMLFLQLYMYEVFMEILLHTRALTGLFLAVSL